MEQVSLGKIGRYDVIRVLGRGGMGEVLLAQDEVLGRRVAIKRPFKSAIAEGLARFQVEAKAATLRHPNIPAVYEMGVHDDLPFIAMEYVEGESLERVIESKREIDLITKLSIVEQVCSALGYAHENGIIHRDIKPANIIVQPDGVAKIIDFGIAKVQEQEGGDSGLTKASQLIGSLHYIAPERFWGGTIDGRVDIFSVGVTLFKFLTGTEPFLGGEATASFKIMNEAHSSLSAYIHDYPPALDEIVSKSLAKNPEDRYRTGEDFADALHEVIEDLKRTRVTELFNDAERLATERRFAPALELLDEAVKLDPSNTQARKLRKFVREHQERVRRAERLRECLLKSEEALLNGNFDEAITQLRDAQNLDPESAEIKAKIQTAEERKRRHERSTKALSEAELSKSRGDINGAMRIVSKALEGDPENKRLIAASTTLARQLELEAQRGRFLELLEQATQALSAREFDAAEAILNEAAAIDASNVETDKLRRELAKVRELDQRRAALEEVQLRVHEFIRSDSYEQASDLLNRALEKLPNETMLHRLKAEVDAEGRKYELRRAVDEAIQRAQDQFAGSPLEALATIQKALEKLPGQERLIAYERTLRQEVEAHRSEDLRKNTVLKARQLMEVQDFDRAVEVLDAYQMEFGQHPDVQGFLELAHREVDARRRSELIHRTLSEARSLISQGQTAEAASLLDAAYEQTNDSTILDLLREVREQKASLERKLESLQKRVAELRDKGDLEQAIKLLQDQSSSFPGNAGLQKLLQSLRSEHEQKSATSNAIRSATEAAQRKDFSAALNSLQAVARAYGESTEITRALRNVEELRSSNAQEIVGQCIESARAALLKNDPAAALEALKGSTPVLEFAGAQKQSEWERIAQSVRKALQQSGATGSTGAFDKQLETIGKVKPRRLPIVGIAVGLVLLLGIGLAVVLKMRTPQPTIVARTQIVLPKVPAGATVQIDGVTQSINPSGGVSMDVKPGKHEIKVSRDGFEPFLDTLEVEPGQSVREEEVKLSPLPPAGVPTGTFAALPQSELPILKVFVNGELKGQKRAGEKIMLPVGSYHIHYAWPGYVDSPDHVLTITKGQELQDPVVLAKLPPSAVKPATQTNTAPVQQTQAAPAPPPVAPTQAAQPKGSLEISSGSIERGQSVTLAWQVENASGAEITELGKVPAAGIRTLTPAKTTTYQLTVNGTELAEKTIEVHEPVKAAAPAAPAPPIASAAAQPSGPDKATLERAVLATYGSVFSRASGKSGKECKAAFNGVFGGKLKDFTSWCDEAKNFVLSMQCNQVGGSQDSPTLTCTEKVSVKLKDGESSDFPPHQKVFQLAMGADGSWRVTGW